ncbi:hypothetical protein cypCar_00048376, partial [Cyprinus carpio]
SFQSLSAPPESTDVNDNPFISLFSSDGLRESVRQLRDKLEDFCKEELKKTSDRDSHQLTLDLNTVNNYLRLSERNRVITYTVTDQSYPDHPDRFNCMSQVFCREDVWGRCYWEIEWSGDVFISVSYKSISRKGRGVDCLFGYNDQSWSLFCTPSRYSYRHNKMQTRLPVKHIISRIGVFVDHSAGTLSFYSVSDNNDLIHTSPDHIHSATLSWVLGWFWIISETVLMNQNRLTRDEPTVSLFSSFLFMTSILQVNFCQ